MTHVRIAIAAVLALGSAACKLNTNFTGGGSSGGGSTGGSPPSDEAGRARELDAVTSAAEGDAYYQRWDVSEVNAKCGARLSMSIDWASFEGGDPPPAVVGANWCGAVTELLSLTCEDDQGKAAVRALQSVRCVRLTGKAATKPTTRVFRTPNGDKHAVDLDGGALTLKIGARVAGRHWHGSATEAAFPAVRWHREVAQSLPALQRYITNWTEDKDGVDLTIDVDAAAFASAGYAPFYYLCGGDGNDARPYPNDGKLFAVLDLLYKTTDRGKQLLKKVRRVTCSATTNPQGKPPELTGDRLIVYFRVLREHFDAAVLAETGQRFPQNDAYFTYALLRNARQLGGECVWRRAAVAKDPEGDELCGKR